MVELRTRKRVLKRNWGNHHQKLTLRGIASAARYTIPTVEGISDSHYYCHTASQGKAGGGHKKIQG